MAHNSNGFRTETELACCYRRVIQQTIDQRAGLHAKDEVRAPGGIPDLVIYVKQKSAISYVITIEFKLSNWRRAVQQAFRHRNFGNEAYVVLDQARSTTAVKNIETFKRANVGLMTIDSVGTLVPWYFPVPSVPFSLEFSKAIASALLAPQESEPSDWPFARSAQSHDSVSQLKAIWGQVGALGVPQLSG